MAEGVPPPVASAAPPVEADDAGQPWVLRLGNYLSGESAPAPAGVSDKGWAVRLGTFLKDRQPGPWSLIANEKPQDPLALRLGTFLNETKPIGILHGGDEPSEPIVVRICMHADTEEPHNLTSCGSSLARKNSYGSAIT